MTSTYAGLGSLEILHPRDTLNRARSTMQAAQKVHKHKARTAGRDALLDEARTNTEEWLAQHGDDITRLLNKPDLTRVALAGDWHGKEQAAAAAFHAAYAAGAEVLVQLGDFGVYDDHDGLRFLTIVEYLADHYNIPLLAIDGNHENFDYLNSVPRHSSGVGVIRPRVLHLRRGLVWSWSGYRFGALGGAPSINRHDLLEGFSWWPEERTLMSEAHRLCTTAGEEPLDVLLTHDTVNDAPLPSKPSYLPPDIQVECDSSRELLSQVTSVVQPTLLVHGHYHEFAQYESEHAQVLALNMELDPGSVALLILES